MHVTSKNEPKCSKRFGSFAFGAYAIRAPDSAATKGTVWRHARSRYDRRMTQPAVKPATYADLEALPAHKVGEIVFGTLYAHARPASGHARTSGRLTRRLFPSFDDDDGTPGGWFILNEPELHLGLHVLVPDLAGWRRERMPTFPKHVPYFELGPDWVCEILSPSTSKLDRGDKLRIYALHEVTHVWLVDPIAETLEVLERDTRGYRIHAVHSADEVVRVPPFDAIELPLTPLWTR
jgi:Uma2 family endonuclease